MKETRYEFVESERTFAEHEILDATARFGDWVDDVAFEPVEDDALDSIGSGEPPTVENAVDEPIATQTRVP